MNGNNLPPIPQQMSIKLEQTHPIECETCGGQFFKGSMMLRKVPAVLAMQRKDQILPVEVIKCEDCGTPVRELLPPGLFKDNVEPPPPPAPQEPRDVPENKISKSGLILK